MAAKEEIRSHNALRVSEVWKYPLAILDEQTVFLPYGSTFLSLISQNDVPTLYVLVNPYTDLQEYWHITLRGTGHPMGEEMLRVSLFAGTISTHEGRLIWHIWYRKEYNGSTEY